VSGPCMRHAAATAQPPGEEGGGRLAKGDTVRHTQDTKAVFPARDRVFLVPPECGTKDIRDSRVKSIIQC
jgi:hypothetical protein